MTLNTMLANPGAGSLGYSASVPGVAGLQYDPSNPSTVIERLRTIRNSIIGSRTKKSSLVKDGSMHDYVRLIRIDLASSPHASEIVALSATIVASLSNTPAPSTLLQLLRAGVQDALLDSLKGLVGFLAATEQHLLSTPESASSSQTDPLKLLEAILRALRSILLAIADQLAASPRWGIGSAWGTSSASSGVSIAGGRPGAGGMKIVGISSREKTAARPLDRGSSNVAMTGTGSSADDLRNKHKQHTRETEAEQSRELRTLSRAFLANVYSASNLPYVIGPLFISRIPQQNAAKQPMGSSVSGAATRDITMHSRTSSSVGMSSPALAPMRDAADGSAASPGASGGSASVDVEDLPLSTRSKILAIAEMVCATIAGTVYIPGQTGLAESRPHLAETPAASEGSPERELSRRRERLLDFTAGDSPYLNPSAHVSTVRDPRSDEDSRGRSHEEATGHPTQVLQAEVIRKASRSRSRMKDTPQRAQGDAWHLPLWEEEDNFDLVNASEGPATVLSVLLAASECGFAKVQEAALWCLAELTRENAEASIRLFRFSTPSGTLPTSMLLNLRRASSPSVRLAAFCCLAHIIKVHPFTPKTNQCVLEVLLELLDQKAGATSSTASMQAQSQVQIQVQAAFAIARLVTDEVELQTLAADNYDALGKLANLLGQACSQSVGGPSGTLTETPAGRPLSGGFAAPTMGVAAPAVDEGLIRLREACLSAIAALTFQQDELRRKVVDSCTPSVLTLLVPCLTFPALGVRVAACRLARALSRSVSILRTSLVDVGIAQKLVALLNDEDEDEVVKVEATAAICNLMTDFSPMRKLVMDLGGLDKLVSLAHGRLGSNGVASQELRLNALWALKNLLWKCESAIKVEVMDKLQWDFVMSQASEGEAVMREQALNILRNAAVGSAEDVQMVVSGVGGQGRLLDLLEKVIWDCKDAGAEGASVIEQAACCLVNLATGSDEHRRMILRRPNLMDALVYFTNHPWKEIRGAAAKCVSNLLFRPSSTEASNAEDVDVSAEAVSRLRAFGLDERLRALSSDAELDVQEKARAALKRFEYAAVPTVVL